jgi:hypothetical protein
MKPNEHHAHDKRLAIVADAHARAQARKEAKQAMRARIRAYQEQAA